MQLNAKRSEITQCVTLITMKYIYSKVFIECRVGKQNSFKTNFNVAAAVRPSGDDNINIAV